MRRGRVYHADSLELLLDTICNTFGGILFIALLVVIMLQMSSAENQSSRASKAEELQKRKLVARLNSAKKTLTELIELQNSQKQTINLIAPADTEKLIQEWREVKLKVKNAKQLQLQLDEELQSQKKQLERINMEYDSTNRAITETKLNLDSLDIERIAEEKKRVTEIKTPVLRPGRGKLEIAIVIQYDRIYIWHKYDELGFRQGFNNKDFLVLSGEENYLQTTPNPLAGIALNDTPQSRSKLNELLSPFSPRDNYLSIVVRPDSLDSFHIFREIASSIGFEYNLIPVNSDDPVLDRGGKNTRIQ